MSDQTKARAGLADQAAAKQTAAGYWQTLAQQGQAAAEGMKASNRAGVREAPSEDGMRPRRVAKVRP